MPSDRLILRICNKRLNWNSYIEELILRSKILKSEYLGAATEDQILNGCNEKLMRRG
jgi:hypothetical protein